MDKTPWPSWLRRYLEPSVTDVLVNGRNELFFDQGRGLQQETLTLQEGTLKNWALSLLSQSGKTWDARHPFCEVVVLQAFRIHIVFPPITEHEALISIRRLGSQLHATDIAKRWNLQILDPVINAVRTGDSILISGATGSGKTTLLNDFLSFVSPEERILVLEDMKEISPAHHHCLRLNTRTKNADGFGEVTLTELLREALRMRPDRIILGECRGREVLDLLQVLNTGHQGAMATIHANSTQDAIKRMELLCLLACNGRISISVIRDLISRGIRWIVQVDRFQNSRIVTEISQVDGKEGDTILIRPVLKRKK